MGSQMRSPVSPPSRSPSVSSIGSPTGVRFSLTHPPHVDLPPAYVAAAAASEIITNRHPHLAHEHGVEYERAAELSDEALALVNSFLDFLLFNMLAASRSSALDPMRRAVEYIVKGKLGQQAIQCGEYELEELISEEDENELAGMQHTPDAESHWDADMVWKRTRLKIFTYMRLSEIEDDEEDDPIEKGMALGEQEGPNRFSRRAGLVSWPAMIFLTGALERIAEQCVRDAGDSAYNRAALSRPGTSDGPYDDDDILIVGEQDVKKLALSQLIGRIWRTWKHTLPRGSPRLSQSVWKQPSHDRGLSFASDVASGRSRRPSNALQPVIDEPRPEPVQDPVITVQSPKSPRPISDQTPNRPKAARHAPRRSRSFGRFPVVVPGRTEAGSWRQSQRAEPTTDQAAQQRLSRLRSNSLPPPTLQTQNLPVDDQSDAGPVSASVVPPPAQARENRKSRTSGDMATEAARAAPQAAAATMNTRAGTYLSREMRDPQKRRSREVRRSREYPSNVETEGQEHGQTSRSAPHLEPPAPAAPSTSSGPSDDEYDPFRADPTGPPLVKSVRQPSVKQAVQMPPPVQETLRTMSQRDSAMSQNMPVDEATRYDPDPMQAALAQGAISTAMFGSTSSQRKAKKPAPLDMSATTASNAKILGRDGAPQADRIPSDSRQNKPLSAVSHGVSANNISPAQTSAGRYEESRTPSSSKLQRTATSETSDAPFHTPGGSPTRFDERPPVTTRSSDPTNSVAVVKPTSPRAQRGGIESAAQRHYNKAASLRESDKEDSVSARSDKEFNDLMSGNQTVKRSLTPKTLTDIEAVDSPKLRQQQIETAHDPPSHMAASDAGAEVPETLRSATGPSPPTTKKASNIRAIRQAAEARIGGGAAASSPKSPKSPKSPRSNGIEARDAREQPGRTNDIADFIRSTAPTSAEQAPQPLSSAATAATATPLATNSQAPASWQQPSVKSVVPNTSRAAQKKQVRPARQERQANDDLISFLNDGPPGAQVNKSRSMETTGSRATDNLGLGTMTPANRSSSQMSQSINESVTSHSGLLPKSVANDRSPLTNATSSRTAPVPKIPEGVAPARKQRRVKDPYAIDSDDEDEDVLTGLPQKESDDAMGLVDFLRSTAPPEDNAPSGPSRKRFASPPRNTRGSPDLIGTSSTAVGGPRPLHKPIPSNEEIKRDPGDQALPHFLKEDRQVRPRESYDSEPGMGGRKGRSGSKSSNAERGGMRGLFKRIGVNG